MLHGMLPNLTIWTTSSLQDSNVNRPAIILFFFTFHLFQHHHFFLPFIYLSILIFATFMTCKFNHLQLYEGYSVSSSLLAINMELIIPP